MNLQRRLAKNIPLTYLFALVSNLNLTHGVWMIFLVSKGFSLLELGIMEGCFHITAFLMEVPTGAVADLWGRKVSRIAGRGFFFVSLLFMYFTDGILLQTLGFALCAIGYNLESGAGEALLYDSLKGLNREEGFMRINGRQELLLQTAFIISFLGGGYFAVRDYSLLFLITGVITLSSLLTACFFIEPPVDDKERTTLKGKGLAARIFESIFHQTKESFQILKGTPSLLLLIVFIELIFTFTTCLFFFLQTYWKAHGLSEWDIGIVYALQCGVAGVTGLFAPKVEKKMGPRGILLAMPLLLVFCLWGVAATPWHRGFFIATGLLEGIIIIAVSDYINRMIPSATRATVLSFQSMIFSLFMIILFPLVGIIGDRLSLETAFFLFAVTGTAVYILFLAFFRKVRVGTCTKEEVE